MCNDGHFGATIVQRNATAILGCILQAFSVDGDYLVGLIRALDVEAQKKDLTIKVMLVITSKSGSTIEPMANFMILEKTLQERNINYEVVAVTDVYLMMSILQFYALWR